MLRTVPVVRFAKAIFLKSLAGIRTTLPGADVIFATVITLIVPGVFSFMDAKFACQISFAFVVVALEG
jgi:hypothetical protein